MPTPRQGQSKEQFINEYMGSKEAQHSFPDDKQRLAVAYHLWAKHSGEKEKNAFTSAGGINTAPLGMGTKKELPKGKAPVIEYTKEPNRPA